MTHAIDIPEHYSVLIVDDNEADRYLLRRLLRRAGLGDKHFEANNGEEALRFFANPPSEALANPDWLPPFLLFLDVNMPRMNGFEFLEAFAKQQEASALQTVIIVMLSSSVRSDDVAEANQYDFVRGYIEKFPNTADELNEQIAQALAAS